MDRRRERVAAARAVRAAAGVLRGQPADPQRRAPPVAAAQPAAGRQLAEHDRDAGRCHRRSPDRRGADPGVRLPLALPDRHPHPDPHPRRGVGPAGTADRGHHREPRDRCRDQRTQLPARTHGAADVLPGRHHRDGLRDASGTVSRGNGRRRLRRSGGWGASVRAAVRRHPDRRCARRGLLRLGVPDRAPGCRSARVGDRLGPGDVRLRHRGRPGRAGVACRCSSSRC